MYRYLRSGSLMLVLLLVLVPIIAGLVMLMLRGENPIAAKATGAIVSAGTFVGALLVWTGGSEFSFRWLSRPFESAFHFGATGISIWLVLPLTICTFFAILATNLSRRRAFVAQ